MFLAHFRQHSLSKKANLAARTAPRVLTLVFLGIFSGDLLASPILFDPYRLLRTGRFAEIRSYFRDKRPENRMQLFAKARSLSENPNPDIKGALQNYLAVMGLYCARNVTEEDFVSCLSPFREEYFGDMMDRLSLWKASEICPKEWTQL